MHVGSVGGQSKRLLTRDSGNVRLAKFVFPKPSVQPARVAQSRRMQVDHHQVAATPQSVHQFDHKIVDGTLAVLVSRRNDFKIAHDPVTAHLEDSNAACLSNSPKITSRNQQISEP